MDYSIVVITASMKNTLQIISKWIFSIGILCTVHMQAQVNTHQQVGQIAELVFSKGGCYENKKQKRECVFQQPVAHIAGANQCAKPNECEYTHEEPNPVIFT